MDDSCAVCAEALEWVAYGPCGHREVCSTCIIRLRFICNDRCCCICKSESSNIFVTKALGDYTNMINDFSAFPANPTEGQVGQYWFHGGAQAYFDDLDHYKMIKAMCKLSCTVCDRKNEQRNGGSKRTGDFNSIEQLKNHLFHQHRLFMCSLCLEGRKIFISEQKLYNRAQLNQHVKTGDSVVDGSESERGGFMGHPTCEFCQNPFYGDNELYLHMSTEHFTCHICQRQHPGQHEYYNDYDDLEIHFRQEHFLCEDEACLAQKFIVFATESEMKRHNTKEHGGRMSRSKRNAALQIPISFRYQRSGGQDQRDRGRGRHPNCSDIQLSMAIQDSLETLNAVRSHDISSNAQTVSSHRGRRERTATVSPFELLSTTNSELSSKYSQALLEESSFPPLRIAPSSSERRSRNAVGSNGNNMAARLRHQNTVKVLNSSRASPVANSHSNSSAIMSHHSRAMSHSGPLISSRPSDDVVPSNLAGSSRTETSACHVSHSFSVSNLLERETFRKISQSPVDKECTSKQSLLKVEDVQSANKALVEKIRAALDFDKDKFAAFKVISMEYCQDIIDTAEYLAYVHQFGLAHLVLELAILCPNARKQTELVEIHKYNMMRNVSKGNDLIIGNGQPKNEKSTRKGKEKCEDDGICSSEIALARRIDNGIMNVEVNDKPALGEVGALPEDACHSTKAKLKIAVDEQANLSSAMEPRNRNDAQSANSTSIGGGNRKKMSKFLKNRLGETSAATLPDNSNLGIGHDEKNEEKTCRKKHPPEIFPVHGVWRNGGGRRLVTMTQRDRNN